MHGSTWLTSSSSGAVRIASVSALACSMSVPARSGAPARHHSEKCERCSSGVSPTFPTCSIYAIKCSAIR